MVRDVFELALDELLSEDAQKQMLAEFAHEEIQKTRERNERILGVASPYTVEVDGVAGAPLTQVRPRGGQIIAHFDVLGDSLAWIGQALIQASPVRSGRFSQSHVLLADNELIEPGQPIPPAEQYVFINTQPYARKIERGLSAQAPDGVYEVVAAMVGRRLGNVAKVFSTYKSLDGISALDSWAQRTSLTMRNRRTIRPGEREAWLRRQPAIIVEPR